MINPNELRIGSYINTKSGALMMVGAISKSGVKCFNLVLNIKTNLWHWHEIAPIPLTPEWLERMGCEVSVYKDEDGALVTMPGLFVCQPFYQRRHSLSISHAPKARKLRYVHDLQNYYQALTGEELTIKETV